MADYPIGMELVVDPDNPMNVVVNGSVGIYAPEDVNGTTLLALKDANGFPLANPLTSNAYGFLPPFLPPIPQVRWKSGEYTGFYNSYIGLRDEALEAKNAAQDAQAEAATASNAAAEAVGLALGPTDEQVDAGIARADIPAHVAAAVPSQLQGLVPGLVAEAIASDDTVANAAAAAVTGEMAQRNVPQNITPAQSPYTRAWADAGGRVALGIKPDGSTHVPVLETQDAKIGTSRFVDVPSQVSGYEKAITDQAGHLAFGIDPVTGNVIIPSIVASNFTGYDIIIVAGQSNSDESDPLTADAYTTDPLVDWWFNGKILPLPTNKGSLGPSMARAYRRRLLKSGRKVLLVPAGVGATGFWVLTGGVQAVWDPALAVGGVRNLYQEMLDKAAAALAAAGTGSKIVALAWSQGENDAHKTGAEYITKFDAFIANVRAALGLANLPVLVGSMVPEHVASGINNVAQIQAAHVDTPRRIQRSAFIPGPTEMARFADAIHFSAQGQALRGEWFVDALARAAFNVSTLSPLPPQNITVTRSGNSAEITWAPPPSRFTAFTIETSTDFGSTWTPATLAGPVELKATIVASSSLPLWVRGKTTAEVGTSIYSITRKA